MATNLRLTFRDAQARELTAAFPYASPSASGTKVRALMEGIIANGASASRGGHGEHGGHGGHE